jgi:hypothetical protein
MICRLFERPDAPGLTVRQVKWALKLRKVFDVTGLDPASEYKLTYTHLFWAGAYARRDRAADILQRKPPYTADLDSVMMLRPWEGGEAYREAVRQGLIPVWRVENELAAWEIANPGVSERYRHFERAMSKIMEEASHAGNIEATV